MVKCLSPRIEPNTRAMKRAPKSLKAKVGPWNNSRAYTFSSAFTIGALKVKASAIMLSNSGISSPIK